MILALTPGDPAGIGPEIVWKVCSKNQYRKNGIHLLCVGARKPFDDMGVPVICSETPPLDKKPSIWLFSAPNKIPPAFRASITRKGRGILLEGFQSGWSIQCATWMVLDGTAAALVTGPISKERLQAGGFPYPGHTEFLADLCRADLREDKVTSSRGAPRVAPRVTQEVTPRVTMMLANNYLRVSLVTTHIALKNVSRVLNRDLIRQAIVQTIEHLRHRCGIRKPRIAVAALNPHAGESGLFGKEEIKIITPEIKALEKHSHGHYSIIGPLPADTLFAKHMASSPAERYDAVVCMYHDQGLIPVKLLDFPRTVNLTLGLPIIRTSVDHGVGFDIVGKGRADPSSLKAAIDMAIQMVRVKTPIF